MNYSIKSLCLCVVTFVAACGSVVDESKPTPTTVAVAPPVGVIAVPPPEEPKTGTIKIVDFDLARHASRIIPGCVDSWERFVGYQACADSDEDAFLKSVPVESGTNPGLRMDNADFTAASIAANGTIYAGKTFSPGSSGEVTVQLEPALRIPKGTCVPFEIVAKVACTQPSSTVGGSWTGACRSGHAPALGLAKDPSDPTRLGIDAVGATSGKKLIASSADSHRGQPMVIRKSKPIVVPQKLSSMTLANVDQDLFKFQVSADPAGSIAWKQMFFEIERGAEIVLSNFRFRKGSVDMDPATYAIIDLVTGNDLKDRALTIGSIAVVFKSGYEETVSGAGNVYTLHVTVSGASPGSSVKTRSLPRVPDGYPFFYPFTGNLIKGSWPDLFDIGGTYTDGSHWSGGGGRFDWSDLSEVPHSPALETAGGSADWTDDQLVGDLTGSVTLTK